jgi:hypothetical protein
MTQSIPMTPPPTMEPPEGKLDELKKQLVKLFPKIHHGSTKEVDRATADLLAYARWAANYWSTQAAVAELEIRKQMESAETATVNGIPVFTRTQSPVKGHWIDPFERDSVAKPKKA